MKTLNLSAIFLMSISLLLLSSCITMSSFFRDSQSKTPAVSTPSRAKRQRQGGQAVETKSNNMDTIRRVNENRRVNNKPVESVESKKEEYYNKETISYNKETIMLVQKKLKLAGYNPGPIDGILGNKTKAAIRLFQRDYGLVVTGDVNEKTLSLLKTIKEHKKETISKETVKQETANKDIPVTPKDHISETKGKNKTTQKIKAPKTEMVRVVGNSDVEVKKNPDIFSDVITTVRSGVMLEMLGKSGEWYKVRTSKGIGYIFSDFIKEK